MRTQTLSSANQAVKTKEVASTPSKTPRNLLITAFVISLLLGAASIALWQTGSASYEVIYALGGAGGALLIGSAIASLITYCRKGEKTGPKAGGSATATPTKDTAKEAAIMALINSRGTKPPQVIEAIKAYDISPATLEKFLLEATKANYFNLCQTMIQEFGIPTKVICEVAKKVPNSNRFCLFSDLSSRLATALQRNDEGTARMIFEADPSLLEEYRLDAMFKHRSEGCLKIFLELYPKVVSPSQRQSLITQFYSMSGDNSIFNRYEELIDEHDQTIEAQLEPFLKADQLNQLIAEMEKRGIDPSAHVGAKRILIHVALAGNLEVVKALVQKIRGTPLWGSDLDGITDGPIRDELLKLYKESL